MRRMRDTSIHRIHGWYSEIDLDLKHLLKRVVLLGGSVLMFSVKGGTVTVLAVANADAGSIEIEPLTIDLLRHASRFTLQRFTGGCARLFRPYVSLGLLLMAVYALSIAAYVA